MKYLLLISLTALLSCHQNRQKQAIARITERRSDTKGQLVIKYRFHTGERWIDDSATISNRVIPSDSLQLRFSPENPRENCLELP